MKGYVPIPHFTGKKRGPEKGSNLPKPTQRLSIRNLIKTCLLFYPPPQHPRGPGTASVPSPYSLHGCPIFFLC